MIIQAQRESHRKYLRWELHYAFIIVNLTVNFKPIFTIIQAQRKSNRKYLRWDLRRAWIIVEINVNFYGEIYATLGLS